MSDAPFRIALLDASLDRDAFRSGTEALDHYFSRQVSQDMRRRVSACFVAITDANCVAGYYTLSMSSLLLSDLPEELGRKLPRYPSVPAVRMGRLAVDRDFQGKGLGGALLADAMVRAIGSEIAAYAMLVDAKNPSAATFYRHHGFISLPNMPMTLFLPLASARTLLDT